MKAKLLKEHTHEGKKLAPGAVIELDQDLYEWLAELKVTTLDIGDLPVDVSVPVPAAEIESVPTVSDAPSEPTEV